MKTKRKKSADERLLERYEAGEFVSTSPTKAELKKFQTPREQRWSRTNVSTSGCRQNCSTG